MSLSDVCVFFERGRKMFLCSNCGKTFASKYNLTRHLSEIHLKSLDKKGTFKCGACDKYYLSGKSLKQHKKKFHSNNNTEETESIASIDVENINNYTFNCLKDFETWKSNVERSENSHYIKHRGDETLKNGNKKTYYKCHRTGSYVSKSKIRQSRIKGSCKIGYVCPASITVTVTPDSRVTIVHYSEHIHSAELGQLHLTKDETAMIARKLSAGVSVHQILDEIRNTNDILTKIHLFTEKDINTINTKYGLNVEEQYHPNDCISVELWTKQFAKLDENNPVIFFKNEGDVVENVDLNIEDFILVLMTLDQKSLLTLFARKIVCIDSTRGLNASDFHLTTLLVIDECGEAVPVSFCISNRTDVGMMTVFFNSIKIKTGGLETDFFMSDDAPAYLNAWIQVMPLPKNVLLCGWLVDKNWRHHIRYIPKGKQCYIYKTLRVLLEEPDKNVFEKALLQFEDILKADEDASVREFADYFSTHYIKCKRMWAYSYRKGTHLNHNLDLEAMHKVITHVYLDGKRCRRIDKCVSLLMKFIRDKLFDRAVKLNKGKVTNSISRIRSSCFKAVHISKKDFVKTDENTWHCLSQTDRTEKYIIKEMMTSKCKECDLVCTRCNICVHTLTCTCPDYNVRATICKHIHAIVKCIFSDLNAESNDQDDTRQCMLENHIDSNRIDNLLNAISGLWAKAKLITDSQDLKYLNDKLGDVVDKLRTIERNELALDSEDNALDFKDESSHDSF